MSHIYLGKDHHPPRYGPVICKFFFFGKVFTEINPLRILLVLLNS